VIPVPLSRRDLVDVYFKRELEETSNSLHSMGGLSSQPRRRGAALPGSDSDDDGFNAPATGAFAERARAIDGRGRDVRDLLPAGGGVRAIFAF
jgi:hypothetical protein